MRPLLLLLALMIMAVSSESALGRSPRRKSTAQSTPALPPFPWTAILETVGPVLAIWLGAVVIRRAKTKDVASPPLNPKDVASLPAAWYAAMSSFFEKRPIQEKPEPSSTPGPDTSRPVALSSNFSAPAPHAPGSSDADF
jgi:hypothetical protein